MPKISQLPGVANSKFTDIFPAVQSGVTSQESLQQVFNLFQPNLIIFESQVTNLVTDLSNRLINSNNLSDVSNLATAQSNIGASSAIWNANALQNISVSNALPSDGQALTFSQSQGKWVPDTPTIGSDAHSVWTRPINNTLAPTNRQVLAYITANSDWEYTSLTKNDVGLGNVANNLQLIASDNLSDLQNVPSAQTNIGASNPVWNANKLQGVNISNTAPTDQYVLTYIQSTGMWTPEPSGIDIDARSIWGRPIGNTNPPTNHQYLGYVTSNNDWEYLTISGGDISGGNPVFNSVTTGGGSQQPNKSLTVNLTGSLDSLWVGANGGDVSIQGNDGAGNFNPSINLLTSNISTAQGNINFFIPASADSGIFPVGNFLVQRSLGGGVIQNRPAFSFSNYTNTLLTIDHAGNQTTNGNVSINGTLTTTGIANIGGNLSVTGNISVTDITTTQTNLGAGIAVWNANKLQGTSISNTAPSTNQILTYNGTSWIPGSFYPSQIMIAGDLFPGNNTASVPATTAFDMVFNTASIIAFNGINLVTIAGTGKYGFQFSQTGIYNVAVSVSYAPATTTGTFEGYFSAVDSSANPTGRRFGYVENNWPTSSGFPANFHILGTLQVSDTTVKYSFFTFQATTGTQTLGFSGAAPNPQTSSYCIWRIA